MVVRSGRYLAAESDSLTAADAATVIIVIVNVHEIIKLNICASVSISIMSLITYLIYISIFKKFRYISFAIDGRAGASSDADGGV